MPLPCIEKDTAPNARHAVIWLHGLGADGHDFAPIIPDLVARDWPGLRFVFPHAPVRPVTLNGGAPMRAWYDVHSLDADIARRQDEAGVRESIGHLGPLIARESDRGVPASRVFLAGFSQGGAIVLAGGVRYPKRLAGVIALSTYLPGGATAAAARQVNSVAQPVFFAHGQDDPVIPVQHGVASARALEQAGFEVEWHHYPMAHQVCAQEIADLGDWLERRFR